MMKKMKKIEKNRTKPGTVLSETVLSGDPLYQINRTIFLKKVGLDHGFCIFRSNFTNVLECTYVQLFGYLLGHFQFRLFIKEPI